MTFLQMPWHFRKFPEIQLREFHYSLNSLFVWGPVGQGMEPPVRLCGKQAPEIRGIKIRLG